jgi:Na+-translocating ferredoxin:NAD+ oxidoreductase subunit C
VRWWPTLNPMRGGISFAATKAATLGGPIDALAARGVLHVPLWNPAPWEVAKAGDPAPARLTAVRPTAEPKVTAGQHVQAGEPLALPQPGSARWSGIFAPVSGVIGAQVTVESSYGLTVPALELTPDPDRTALRRRPSNHESVAPDEIVAHLEALGVALDAEPMGARTRPPLQTVIVDALESAPFATARVRTMLDHAPALLDTAGRLAELLRVNVVHIVVDEACPTLLGQLRPLAHGRPVRIVSLPSIHPQSHPRLLFRAVTGRGLPPDCTPRARGVWIVGACELLDIHQALTEGTPPVLQVLTVAGDVVQRPGNYRVPIGMSVGAILERVGVREAPARLVLGDALSGVAVRSTAAIIQRGIEGLYAWSAAAAPDRDPTGCLRCGFCLDVCPVGIDPRGVLQAAESRHWAEAPRWAPQVCVDCGLCDYGCPAALPLMTALRRARARLDGGTAP